MTSKQDDDGKTASPVDVLPVDHTSIETQTTEFSQMFNVSRIKTQEFFTSDPELWFFLLESQFVVNRISADNSMYHTVVSQLSQTVAEKIRGFLRQPRASGKYIALKNLLIKEFTPSDHGKIKKLLSQMDLGDKKPSRLLEEMRNLAGENFEDKFLAALWLGCLPMNLQQILSPWSDEPLDKVAKMADRIIETTNVVSVATTQQPSNSHKEDPSLAPLARLSTQMEM